MKKMLFAAALCVAATSNAFASELCDTYGEAAGGFALERDKGTTEQSLLDKINKPVSGGLSEDNKAIVTSLLNLAYKRTDLAPMALYELVQSKCNDAEMAQLHQIILDLARKQKAGG